MPYKVRLKQGESQGKQGKGRRGLWEATGKATQGYKGKVRVVGEVQARAKPPVKGMV